MARKGTYAKPIPANTMTIQLPFADEAGMNTALSTEGAAQSLKATSANKRDFTWADLVSRFPLYAPTTQGQPVIAVKLSSVCVGPGIKAGVGPAASESSTVNSVGGMVKVPAVVEFGDGVEYEASNMKALKVRPSDKNVFNSAGWKNIQVSEGSGHAFTVKVYNGGKVTLGTTGNTVAGAASEISNDVAFSYRGELKYVVLSVKLADVAKAPAYVYP